MSAIVTSDLAPATDWQNGEIDPTRDGVKLRIDRISDGLGRPNDAEARGYTCEPFEANGITHDVWRAGSGPAVIVMRERSRRRAKLAARVSRRPGRRPIAAAARQELSTAEARRARSSWSMAAAIPWQAMKRAFFLAARYSMM